MQRAWQELLQEAGLSEAGLEPCFTARHSGSRRCAKPALRHMLSDTRAAPVFGSQEYMVYKQYNNRVCDYALMFLEQIGGKSDFRLPVSVDERDKLIKGIAAK